MLNTLFALSSEEFEDLERRIHHIMLELERLQDEYMQLTGMRYVISGPKPKPERKPPTEGGIPCNTSAAS